MRLRCGRRARRRTRRRRRDSRCGPPDVRPEERRPHLGQQPVEGRHSEIGERIVAAAPALGEPARLVRATHERWDGTGYPDRLVGEEIPLGARIIAVCDAFDAMTTDRPYQRAMGPEAALAELRRCAGTQFDPAVIGAFSLALLEPSAVEMHSAAA